MSYQDTPPDDHQELEGPDELAIAGIIEGKPLYESAELAGYSARTLQRRQKDPRFRERLAQRRDDRVAQIAGQLGSIVDEAIEVLRGGLRAERPSDQLRAVALVLDRYRLFRSELEVTEDLATMRDEVARLRELVDGRGDAGEGGVAE